MNEILFLFYVGKPHTPRKCGTVSEGKPNLSRKHGIEKEGSGLDGRSNLIRTTLFSVYPEL